jgi:hypothetical protein
MLAELEEGALPPGIHVGTWDEVVERFGWNERRRLLLDGLRRVLDELARAGCERIWLDGSFVTSKRYPGDFDLVWDLDGVDLGQLDPVILDLDPPRRAQHDKYAGDILPNVTEGTSGMPFVEFFQQDSLTGSLRGIVEMRLKEWR